jgi:phage-related protein
MSSLSFHTLLFTGIEKQFEILVHPEIESYSKKLIIKDRATFFKKLKIFKDHGFELTTPYVEKVDNLIWAYRFIMNKKWIRIFYFFHNGKFVFLHILEKKTNRFPKQDVELANSRARTYILGSSSGFKEQALQNYVSI